jgi:inositol phosphorylceramide mannosyltransferase catalytic subunit
MCLRQGAVLAYMSDTWWLRHNVPNAWMASVPGHPLWLFSAAHVLREFRPGMQDEQLYREGIEQVTGPVALRACYEAYQVRRIGHSVPFWQPCIGSLA